MGGKKEKHFAVWVKNIVHRLIRHLKNNVLSTLFHKNLDFSMELKHVRVSRSAWR